MSCFPETAEEFEEFNQGFVEGYKEQEKTTGDFHQGPSIPQMAEDRRFYGDQMIAPDGYQAFYEQQMTDPRHQINHYGQMTSTSSGGENIYRGQLKILGGEHTLHGYQTAAYRGDQNLCVDPQGTSPVGGQFLYDWQVQSPGFNTVHHGSKKTNSSEEENLSQFPKTTASCEDTFYLGQMKTTSVDENVCPGQKRSPNVKGSHSPQRTSFGNQSPYVGGFTYPSSCFVAQSQPLESFSVSSSVQGELPQEKSDLESQSHVTQKKPPSLKEYFCPYQDCEKAYTKSFHLKDHVKKHTGEKPYVCNKPGCSWTFFRSTDLRRHQRKHSGERLFPCPKCNKNFSRLSYLKQHQKICTSPNAGT